MSKEKYPQDYRGKDAITCYQQIHHIRINMKYMPGVGFYRAELMAATDAAAHMYNPNLDDKVPKPTDIDCPSEQDFFRLEHWFLRKAHLEIYAKGEEPAGAETMQSVGTAKAEPKKRRGAGERDDQVKEAYKKLTEGMKSIESQLMAKHIAKWINNKYDHKYWKMNADNVMKSKPWKLNHTKK